MSKTEGDDWSAKGGNVLSEAKLRAVKAYLNETDCVVLEHRHYRGARSPTRLVFDDYDELRAYLGANAVPGDSVYLFRYPQDEALIASGKIRDKNGRTPKAGAY